RFVKLKNYAMVNLIARREIVPELIQGNFTAEKVASEIQKLVLDSSERETMIKNLKEVRERLRVPSDPAGETAIARAAAAVAAAADAGSESIQRNFAPRTSV
ncbi:MAG TPA: hypothetical protein VF493_09555, partial [Terriglobales bacterium]